MHVMQWIDLSALPFDASLPLTQSNVVQLFQSLRSRPDYYVLYIFVGFSRRIDAKGERCFDISPVTATIQKEINDFYLFAKEEEGENRGVHRTYVLSILKHIQSHYDRKLQRPSLRQPSVLDPLRFHRLLGWKK